MGYCMHIAPAPILMMFPTVGVAKRMSKRRIATLIGDSPVLRNIVSSPKSRDGSNTILEKDFPGGNILITGANSTGDLRAISIRYFIPDEIDEYSNDLGDQGDVIEIARVRTNTYDDNKKIFFISTPTIKGQSNIEKLFLETDQHYCFLPCPHCASDAPITGNNFEDLFSKEPPPGYQKLVLEQFVFTKGNPAAVYYKCIHCEKEIHNYHKAFMLPRHKWVPEFPEKSNNDRIGFHLNSFYSPIGMYSWATMAHTYEMALKDPLKMKTFIQTSEGKPYEEEGDQPPHQVLFERSMDSYNENEIPAEVCFLTAGVDVQKDRVEIEIVGWGKGKRSYSISFRQLPGRPEESEVWRQLGNILSETWVRKADGVMLGLSLTFIDEGYSTNEVYAFCISQGMHRIVPVNGLDTQSVPISSPQAVWLKKDGKKELSLQHININTDYYKSALYAHLRLSRTDVTGPNGPELFCHFPKTYQEDHYKRLTNEKKIASIGTNGREKAHWKKLGRNEQLDCRVYAMAAATLFGIDSFTDDDYDRMTGSIKPLPEEKKTGKNKGKLPRMGGLPGL